jgi:ubiquinone/menaquinone biosynthesis C-methylase UbiE
MFSEMVARQLGHPNGIFGRFLGNLWNRRNAALNQITFEKLDLHPNDRVLDIGFGGGYLLDRILPAVPDGFVAGVDVSEAMVSFCERRFKFPIKAGKLELKLAPVESIPFPTAHFSKACSVNSIFYWQNVPQAFSEIHRVLTDDGKLLLCFTCRESLVDKEFTRHGVTPYAIEQIEELLAMAGFGKFWRTRHHDQHRDFWCLIASK